MNDILKKAIEKELIKKPSPGFTDEVMDAIFAQKPAPAYQPLISTKMWILIVLILIFVLTMALSLMPETATNSFHLAFLDKVENYFKSDQFKMPDLFSGVNLLLISGVSFSIFLLLFFDTMFYKKRRGEI